MKFNDIKEQLQTGKVLSELIKFPYVSLASRKNMVDNVMAISLNKDENGFMKIDYTLKSLFESLYIMANYTDIEFDGLYDLENNIDSVLAIEYYDFCKQNGVSDYVTKNCDYGDFTMLLENEIAQEIEINNSVASILSQVLNKIALKLPAQGELGGMMQELPNILASFNKPKSVPRKKKV